MIKLKDLLIENDNSKIKQIILSSTNVLRYWIVNELDYTNVYSAIAWRDEYDYREVQKFEKKMMKLVYKLLKQKFGIDKNNIFVKLHDKILRNKIFSKGGYIDKQLTFKAAGSAFEHVRNTNIKLIKDYWIEELTDFLESVIVMGK